MPTPKVKSLGETAERWTRRTAAASPDYQRGVETTSKDWSGAAVAAGPSYRQAVTAAAAAGRFEKGVTKAGTAKWKKNTVEKGPARYAQGAAVAGPEFQAGIGPYLELIGRTDLPARRPAGDPSNIGRITPITQALHTLKMR